MQLGKISSDDLRLFLEIPPHLFEELEEARELLLEKREKIFAADTQKAVWCHFYELPAKEHFPTVLVGLTGTEILKEIVESPNQIQGMFSAVDRFNEELEADEDELSEDEINTVRKALQTIFGSALSVINSFRCLLVFGCYLNDLIAVVREGGAQGDKAMLHAIKIDPTVLGCKSVVIRLSRAVMENDQRFLRKIKAAMCGQLTKREQRNYQAMRLVLQILYETGAISLAQEELYQLFVEELKLVRGEHKNDEGNVANNLRQFSYHFMKQKSVSQKL